MSSWRRNSWSGIPIRLTILTEVGGKVAYGDIVEGVTMKEEFDEVTGLSRKVIIEHSGATLRPRVSIKDEGGKTAKVSGGSNTVARYLLPVGAHIFVEKGASVHPGDVLAKIPRETTKTKDITGGLPRVAELFEARKPKEQAVISEIDGEVSYGGFVKGQRKVLVDNKMGDVKEYFIPKGKHVNVHEGDWVRAGEPLMDGSANPHDILDVLGPNELQKYLGGRSTGRLPIAGCVDQRQAHRDHRPADVAQSADRRSGRHGILARQPSEQDGI